MGFYLKCSTTNQYNTTLYCISGILLLYYMSVYVRYSRTQAISFCLQTNLKVNIQSAGRHSCEGLRGASDCVVSCTSSFACRRGACMGFLVSGTQTKESCIKEEKAQLCQWNPLGLHNVRWPSSSKQDLKEPAPGVLPAPFPLFLIPGAVCGREGQDGLGWSKCKNPRDLHSPETELHCNPSLGCFFSWGCTTI